LHNQGNTLEIIVKRKMPIFQTILHNTWWKTMMGANSRQPTVISTQSSGPIQSAQETSQADPKQRFGPNSLLSTRIVDTLLVGC
jgi:hypothetical protein